MSPQEIDTLAATAARRSLLAYAIGLSPQYETPPHLEMLAQALEMVTDGRIKRLIITMPPRHGKQIAHDVLVPTPDGFRRHSRRPRFPLEEPDGRLGELRLQLLPRLGAGRAGLTLN